MLHTLSCLALFIQTGGVCATQPCGWCSHSSFVLIVVENCCLHAHLPGPTVTSCSTLALEATRAVGTWLDPATASRSLLQPLQTGRSRWHSVGCQVKVSPRLWALNPGSPALLGVLCANREPRETPAPTERSSNGGIPGTGSSWGENLK